MTSRRDRDRDDRGYREPKGGRSGESSGAARPSRAKLNEFFVDGEGIHREVLQREICKYLGPEAYSRPSKYNGTQGFIVTAVRPFTPKMLDDLQELSDAYMSENREITRRGHQGITYEASETSRRQDQILRQGGGGMDYDYPVQAPPYTMASTSQGYPAVSSSAYTQNLGGAYAGTGYLPDATYAQGPTYGAPQGVGYGTGYAASSTRPTTNENYTYGNESPRNDASYRQPSAYSGTGRGAAARPPDPRDPRPDPRFQVDPRADPRMDPRMMQGNYQPYPSTGDMDPRYDYVSATPPVQSGRGGPAYPTGRGPTGYDPRDPYRNEPIREERRRR